VVAWFALVVSSLTLSWQLYYAVRVDRAALRVKVIEGMNLADGGRVVAITVTNVGRRATVLQNAHPVLGKPRHVRDRLPRRLRGKSKGILLLLPEREYLETSTKFPARLDVGDEANVYVRRDYIHAALHNNGETWFHVRASASSARRRTSRSCRLNG
jgi:hypothetical protein